MKRRGTILSVIACLALLGCGGESLGDIGGEGQGALEHDCGNETCGPCTATVARVLDGDTIELDATDPETGKAYKIRYIGVDTPETFGEEECYGPEAKAFNKEQMTGQRVLIEYDVACTDRYGRLLAYVYREDGELFNARLLEEGYGCLLLIPPSDTRGDELRAAEVVARDDDLGVWGACPDPCN